MAKSPAFENGHCVVPSSNFLRTYASHPQVWEEWRDEERRLNMEKRTPGGIAEQSPFPSATRLSSADVVLCSLERLADIGSEGVSMDAKLARSVKWTQVWRIF